MESGTSSIARHVTMKIFEWHQLHGINLILKKRAIEHTFENNRIYWTKVINWFKDKDNMTNGDKWDKYCLFVYFFIFISIWI